MPPSGKSLLAGSRRDRSTPDLQFTRPLAVCFMDGTEIWYRVAMRRKHAKTLEAIFARPTSGNIQWRDIEALFIELGAAITEREGSRIAVILFGQVQVYHRPHPKPDTDKGAVTSVRKWLESNGVKP